MSLMLLKVETSLDTYANGSNIVSNSYHEDVDANSYNTNRAGTCALSELDTIHSHLPS